MSDDKMTVYSVTWNNNDGRTMEGPSHICLSEMANTELVTIEQLVGLKVGDSKTFPYDKERDKGWTSVTIEVEESETYLCNCCQTRQPGDGLYDICHHCGWENEPGETQYADTDGGPNHMSLNEGRTNFKKHAWYQVPCKGCQVKEGHGSWRCRCDWPSYLPMKEESND